MVKQNELSTSRVRSAPVTGVSAMEKIEVFVQAEGLTRTELVALDPNSAVSDLAEAAFGRGVERAEDLKIFLEVRDEDDGQTSDHSDDGCLVTENMLVRLVELGICHDSHVHFHRSSRLHVTFNYNADRRFDDFSPAATVGHVLRWALLEFHIDEAEATEFGLFVCEHQGDALDEDIHIGRLTICGSKELCFDLAPKHRVQG